MLPDVDSGLRRNDPVVKHGQFTDH
jgi:hypothetical protein